MGRQQAQRSTAIQVASLTRPSVRWEWRLCAVTSRELVCVFGGPVFEAQRWAADELGQGVGGLRGFAFADALEGLGHSLGYGRWEAGAHHVFDCDFDGDVDDAERPVDEAREDFDLLRCVDELGSGEVVDLA